MRWMVRLERTYNFNYKISSVTRTSITNHKMVENKTGTQGRDVINSNFASLLCNTTTNTWRKCVILGTWHSLLFCPLYRIRGSLKNYQLLPRFTRFQHWLTDFSWISTCQFAIFHSTKPTKCKNYAMQREWNWKYSNFIASDKWAKLWELNRNKKFPLLSNRNDEKVCILNVHWLEANN